MYFEFGEYYGELVLNSFVYFAGALIYLIYSFIKYKYVISKKNIKYRKGYLVFVIIIFSLICSIGLGTMNTRLIFEKEEDKVIASGVITNIRSVSGSPRLYYEDELVHAKYITIDDMEYYIMYIGNYEVGDSIIIEYLPKSHIVLSINEDG